MDLLGSAVDGNGPQIFVLTDAGRAASWRGAADDTQFDAALAAFGDEAAGVRSVGGIDLVAFGTGGWNLVYRVGEALVLVDGTFEEEREVLSVAGDEENVSEARAFEAYVNAPASGQPASVIDVPSGWVCVMSATARYEQLDGDVPPTLDILESESSGVLQVDDADGGHALFVRIPAKRLRVYVEGETESDWGSAARAVLVPG